MRIRNVLQEFEAHLQPVQPGTRMNGKSAWKHYADGTVRIRISISNIPLPNNSVIDLDWMRHQLQGYKCKATKQKSIWKIGQVRVFRSSGQDNHCR